MRLADCAASIGMQVVVVVVAGAIVASDEQRLVRKIRLLSCLRGDERNAGFKAETMGFIGC